MTRLLDITRLIRRAGRPMTGVDRVEFAYLRTLSARSEPLFCLARTPVGYILLDHAGARHMAEVLGTEAFGPMDAIGALSPRRPKAIRRAEAEMRRIAYKRALPQRLSAMLRKHVPSGARYINVGHSNLTDRVISAVKSAQCTIAVMVHDVIPLEAPEMQRPESVGAFRRFLNRTSAHADLIICNSADTWTRAQPFLDRVPNHVVAHLGVELASEGLPPDDVSPVAPYFMTIGTIEPRKNHALLLDVWEKMGATAPQLIIAGRRGWKNEAVFARLDAKPRNILEVPDLSDEALVALLKGAHGMLFPSHLEGYGLPPMEAAALGIPVVCQPLPVFKEIMGHIPIYVNGNEVPKWQAVVEKLAQKRSKPRVFTRPSWTEHFKTVLMLT